MPIFRNQVDLLVSSRQMQYILCILTRIFQGDLTGLSSIFSLVILFFRLAIVVKSLSSSPTREPT